MSERKRELDIEIISNIDDDIIEKNSKRRFELFTKMAERRKKKKKITVAWLSAAASLMLIFGILMAVILPALIKQVPVYQGMTVSGEFPTSQSANAEGILPDFAPVNLSLTEPTYINPYNLSTGNGNGNANGHDKNGKTDIPEETVVEQVKDSLNIVGGEKSIYYAEKEQDIYITVHVDNPDSFEILSFTLNGKKYSSYMFEEGSDMENLVLKVNVGDTEGILDYTIDAIKYIDGTEIKDVRMEGDKTVKVGVATDKQPTAVISGEKISFNDISLSVAITDTLKLLELSEGRVDVVLYDGENIIANKSLSIAEATSIKFDGLKPATEYTYVIAASYDALDGSGFNTYILASKTFTTLEAVMFENVNVGQESVSFGLIWDENYSDREIVSIALYQGETKIKDVATTATSIDGLLSSNEYTVIVEYTNNGKTDNIYLTFTTAAKAIPTLSITNPTKTLTSVGFEIDYTDPDATGEISKIELVHATQGTVLADNLNVREFKNLLSNNTYTVKVSYTYNLNDGQGDHIEIKKLDIKTDAKTEPTVTINNPTKTQTSVGFGVDVTDVDNICNITKVELLYGDNQSIVASDINVREFTGLAPYTKYTIKISFSYDLNDGVGVHNTSTEHIIYTVPIFETTESRAIDSNDGKIFIGDTVVLQIKIDNPSKLVAESVKINGKGYAVNSALSTSTVLRVNFLFDDSFEGGATELVIESITFLGDIEKFVYEPKENNTVNCFVNGVLRVTGMEMVDASGNKLDVVYPSSDSYFTIYLDNKTGYDVTSVTINGSDLDAGNLTEATYTSFVERTAEYVKIKVSINKGGIWEYCLSSITYQNEYINQSDSISNIKKGGIFSLSSDVIVEIKTVNDLKNMNDWKHYKLMNDIDISGLGIENFGNFRGYFDGNGKSISGYTVLELNSTKTNLGLFSSAMGMVKNLNITDVSVAIESDDSVYPDVRYGGFAAIGYNYLRFINVTHSGSVNISATNASACAGGLVAFFEDDDAGMFVDAYFVAENCINNADISATGRSAGFIGYADPEGTLYAHITDSTNNGDIYSSIGNNNEFLLTDGTDGHNIIEITNSVNNGKIG